MVKITVDDIAISIVENTEDLEVLKMYQQESARLFREALREYKKRGYEDNPVIKGNAVEVLEEKVFDKMNDLLRGEV